jgi:hypothetical protein
MKALVIMLALGIGAPMALIACDRTLSEQTKTSQTDNGTQTETKTVVQQPNGNVTVDKEKTSTVNNNP